MPVTTTERLAALIGLVAAIALFFLAVSAKTERTAVHVAAQGGTEAPPAPGTPQAFPPATPVASRTPTTGPARATTALLELTAARGDCWLSVHAGSPAGKVLYEGVLTSGRSIRVQGDRLWVRLGAGANLDLTLNGRKVAALPVGTADVVVTPSRIRPAA
jgi:hypothetical protein